jgi:cephalosporin hydroxylase
MEAQDIIEALVRWQKAKQRAANPVLGFFPAGLRSDHRRVQQDFEELEAYVEVLGVLTPREVAVEIGYHCGGTHFAWTKLFPEVISIECDYNACCRGIVDFAGSGSKLLHGDSRDSMTVRMLQCILGNRSIDHLFVDGDHAYSSVHADFLNYAPLVRKGGVIGFHDSRWDQAGVKRFLADLQAGEVYRWSGIELKEIYLGPRDFATGISYFYKT